MNPPLVATNYTDGTDDEVVRIVRRSTPRMANRKQLEVDEVYDGESVTVGDTSVKPSQSSPQSVAELDHRSNSTASGLHRRTVVDKLVNSTGLSRIREFLTGDTLCCNSRAKQQDDFGSRSFGMEDDTVDYGDDSCYSRRVGSASVESYSTDEESRSYGSRSARRRAERRKIVVKKSTRRDANRGRSPTIRHGYNSDRSSSRGGGSKSSLRSSIGHVQGKIARKIVREIARESGHDSDEDEASSTHDSHSQISAAVTVLSKGQADWNEMTELTDSITLASNKNSTVKPTTPPRKGPPKDQANLKEINEPPADTITLTSNKISTVKLTTPSRKDPPKDQAYLKQMNEPPTDTITLTSNKNSTVKLTTPSRKVPSKDQAGLKQMNEPPTDTITLTSNKISMVKLTTPSWNDPPKDQVDLKDINEPPTDTITLTSNKISMVKLTTPPRKGPLKDQADLKDINEPPTDRNTTTSNKISMVKLISPSRSIQLKDQADLKENPISTTFTSISEVKLTPSRRDEDELQEINESPTNTISTTFTKISEIKLITPSRKDQSKDRAGLKEINESPTDTITMASTWTTPHRDPPKYKADWNEMSDSPTNTITTASTWTTPQRQDPLNDRVDWKDTPESSTNSVTSSTTKSQKCLPSPLLPSRLDAKSDSLQHNNRQCEVATSKLAGVALLPLDDSAVEGYFKKLISIGIQLILNERQSDHPRPEKRRGKLFLQFGTTNPYSDPYFIWKDMNGKPSHFSSSSDPNPVESLRLFRITTILTPLWSDLEPYPNAQHCFLIRLQNGTAVMFEAVNAVQRTRATVALRGILSKLRQSLECGDEEWIVKSFESVGWSEGVLDHAVKKSLLEEARARRRKRREKS